MTTTLTENNTEITTRDLLCQKLNKMAKNKPIIFENGKIMPCYEKKYLLLKKDILHTLSYYCYESIFLNLLVYQGDKGHELVKKFKKQINSKKCDLYKAALIQLSINEIDTIITEIKDAVLTDWFVYCIEL